jgi:outer membrane protein assembly factor BamB
VHDGRVFSVGATGLLNCLDARTGRSVWTVDIQKDTGSENIAHGVCGSPLVVDDRVLVSPTGSRGPSLAAYDSSAGQRVWAAGTRGASYSSPMLTELCGVRQVLAFDSDGVTGHDAADGRPLWHFPWTNGVKTNCSQPIPHAGGSDQVFVSTEYDKGCALFRVDRSADDTWSTHTIWSNNRLKSKFSTPVAVGDYVYGLDSGILACRDLATGTKGWKNGRYGHGQILLAGDLLIVLTESGDIVFVEPSPRQLRELGRIHALDGKTWNHPSLAGPYLLVRNDREAACYELILAAE